MIASLPRTRSTAIPPTWCLVHCEECQETWTVDTADFSPALAAIDVERLLMPLLDAHGVEHGWGW